MSAIAGDVDNVNGDIGPVWHEELSTARRSHFLLVYFLVGPRNQDQLLTRRAFGLRARLACGFSRPVMVLK